MTQSSVPLRESRKANRIRKAKRRTQGELRVTSRVAPQVSDTAKSDSALARVLAQALKECGE